MDNGRAALVFFYGVFWCSALGVVARYRPFDTTLFYKQGFFGHAVRRFVVSFFLLTVSPIAMLSILYAYVVPDMSGVRSIIAAAAGATSVFGFHRILHAILASERTHERFYSDKAIWEDVVRKWSPNGINTFWAHFGPGLLYLTLFPGVALWVGRFHDIVKW